MSIHINIPPKITAPIWEKTECPQQRQQELCSASVGEQQTVSLHPRAVAAVQAAVDARTEERRSASERGAALDQLDEKLRALKTLALKAADRTQSDEERVSLQSEAASLMTVVKELMQVAQSAMNSLTMYQLRRERLAEHLGNEIEVFRRIQRVRETLLESARCVTLDEEGVLLASEKSRSADTAATTTVISLLSLVQECLGALGPILAIKEQAPSRREELCSLQARNEVDHPIARLADQVRRASSLGAGGLEVLRTIQDSSSRLTFDD